MELLLVALVGLVAVLALADGVRSADDGAPRSETPHHRADDMADDDFMASGVTSLSASEIHPVASAFDDDDWITSDCGGINPGSGLPMVGCVDIAGNPYGCGSSLSHDDDIFSTGIDHWSNDN